MNFLHVVQPHASTTLQMRVSGSFIGGLAFLLIAGSATAQNAASRSYLAVNPVFQSLVQPPQDELLRLSAPRFTDDQTAEQQREVLARVGGERYSLDALLRPSPLAPHVLQLERQRLDSQPATAQRVRVVFMLQGDLETFAKESFLQSLLAGGEDSDDAEGGSRALTDEELRAAGVELAEVASNTASPAYQATQEHYRLVHGELFSRVRFSGVVRSFVTRSDESLLLALRFDERFAAVPGLAPAWQRLERDEAGTLQVAEQGDFDGGGAWLKITRWKADPQMLVFEAELLLLEPQAWFGGSNLLGSKLPPAIQSQVREIRRAALRAAK